MKGPGVEQMAQSAPTPAPGEAEDKDKKESKKSSSEGTDPTAELPPAGLGKKKAKAGGADDPGYWQNIYAASGQSKDDKKKSGSQASPEDQAKSQSAPSPLGDSPSPSPSPAMAMSASPSMGALPPSGQMAGGPNQAQMGQAMEFAADHPELVKAAMTMGS